MDAIRPRPGFQVKQPAQVRFVATRWRDSALPMLRCFRGGISFLPSNTYLIVVASMDGRVPTMTQKPATLDDKYDLTKDRIFISGPQVMVRATLAQKALDREAGLNTAGYITGYRGSPVGGVDQAFERAKAKLEPEA